MSAIIPILIDFCLLTWLFMTVISVLKCQKGSNCVVSCFWNKIAIIIMQNKKSKSIKKSNLKNETCFEQKQWIVSLWYFHFPLQCLPDKVLAAETLRLDCPQRRLAQTILAIDKQTKVTISGQQADLWRVSDRFLTRHFLLVACSVWRCLCAYHSTPVNSKSTWVEVQK